VVADKNTGALGIETSRLSDLESHAGEPENVAEESAIHPVEFATVNAEAENQQECAAEREMNSADRP
jgi:hypothetical protein